MWRRVCNLPVYILIWVLHGSPDAFHMIAAAMRFMDRNFHHLSPARDLRFSSSSSTSCVRFSVLHCIMSLQDKVSRSVLIKVEILQHSKKYCYVKNWSYKLVVVVFLFYFFNQGLFKKRASTYISAKHHKHI